MTPSSGPISAARPGISSRVIQGFFPGGRPKTLQPSPALAAPVRPQVAASVQSRPDSPPAPILPGRAATGAHQPAIRPGQPPRVILPAKPQPGALVPAMPPRPQLPRPILPAPATPTAVQPQAGNAFALPANFMLKPHGSGQPLPEPILRKMEAFYNTSFADVRVHVGPEATAIGALAFTHGSDLYFAPGQYNPQSIQGQHLLGHELTHVVQQRAGRVRNPLGSGLAVVQDPALEAEADRMGMRAASAPLPIPAKITGSGSVAGLASRPKTVAANGAILPARVVDHASVQRRTGPILARRPGVVAKKSNCAPISGPPRVVQRVTLKEMFDELKADIDQLASFSSWLKARAGNDTANWDRLLETMSKEEVRSSAAEYSDRARSESVEPTIDDICSGRMEMPKSPGVEIDKLLQDSPHVSEYIIEQVKSGKKVAGDVVVLKDAEFAKRHWEDWLHLNGHLLIGKSKDVIETVRMREASKIDRVHGFQSDKDGKIYLRPNKVGFRIAVHEAVHKFGGAGFASALGHLMNEGATDYIAMLVCAQIGAEIETGYYSKEKKMLMEILGSLRVNDKELLDAYFRDDPSFLNKLVSKIGPTATVEFRKAKTVTEAVGIYNKAQLNPY